ncbi:hypothetical protein SIM91_02820 [Rhodococcus opacus]|uniref:hypothetical protein n=1 Tax=Rhodococcus opacus TaxID=37919 RepID=UPI000A7320AA|nr:hypothetical protein [Rhodococcus opacus]MDX5962275.1 hypothetical protein [Rhodococcus opacus]NKY74831.1 hypothetical protein [Rhodococcus opacus]
MDVITSVSVRIENHSPGVTARSSFYELPERRSLTFGRDRGCDIVLQPTQTEYDFDPAISRLLGEIVGTPAVGTDSGRGGIDIWNYSSTNWIVATGPRGFTMNLPPESHGTASQEFLMFWVEGAKANYGLYITAPQLQDTVTARAEAVRTRLTGRGDREKTRQAAGLTSLKGSFPPHHQLIFESIFQDYLDPRPGVFPRPRPVRAVVAELADHPTIKRAYPDRPFTGDSVNYVLKRAIGLARDNLVPGMGGSADGDTERSGDQAVAHAEWVRHRLAMFFLGTEVISSQW